MVEAPVWVTIAGSLIALVGGGVTALVSAYYNRLIKKRENYFEIYKHKMTVISQTLPIYGKLGSYYSELAGFLSNLSDIERTLFCACKILHYEDLIFEKYGTIQLDDLQAEEIITNLALNVPYMINLVRKVPNYVAFRKHIRENTALMEMFRTVFENISRERRSIDTPNTEQKCRWYSELIFLEVNEVYHIWYNTHPVEAVYRLSGDLKEYLMKKHPEYYDRIRKWEIGGYLK